MDFLWKNAETFDLGAGKGKMNGGKEQVEQIYLAE